jgi:hypothetical protein
LEHLKGGHSTKEDDELLQQFGTEEKEVLVQIAAQKERIRNASRQRRWGDEDGDGKEAKAETEEKEKAEEEEAKKKKFIRRCMKAGCQGFLSTAWKCGICDHYSCSKCFTVRGPAHDTPHTCAKEDLETAELIRSDSKPCPKCGEFINRSSGCSQMFCVTCRTPWDWNTGKIVTKGVIHNPHYYEWLRRNGGEMPRNPADIPCGGYPQGYELRPIHQCASKRCAKYFFEFHRVCMEIQEDTERNYRSHLDEGGLRDTHVRFLLGDFDERVWGQRLAQAEKRRKRDAEIQEVFTAFRMVAVELLNRIQHYRDETVDVFTLLPSGKANAYLEEWHKEVVALIQMVNEGLKVISLSHHCSVPHIDIVEMTRGVFYRYDTRLWKEESARRMKRNQPRNGNQVAEEEEEKKQEEIESVPFSDTEDEDEEDEEVQLALAIERSLVRHE